jgi:hypothetical protein
MPKMPPVPAAWEDDCQGKKDYDGRLVQLSTRYWPAGYSPTPSAKSGIYLGSTGNDYLDDAVTLAEREFEAPTQAEVQRAVEAWAKEQYARIGAALAREFGVELSSEGRSS